MQGNRKKILHVLFSGLGGVSSVVFSIIEADKEKEAEHSILFYGIERVTEFYLAKCETNGIAYSFIQKKRGIDLKAARKVFKEYTKSRPDYIFLHNMTLIIPSWMYVIFNKCKIISIEHTANSIKTRLEKACSILSMFMAYKIVLLSEEYKEELRKISGLLFRGSNIHIIPNGINTDLYIPGKIKEIQDIIKIGMLSRLSITKDHVTLLKAFRNILAKDYNVKLYIAGDGETRKELEKLVTEMSIQKYVTFTGILNEQQCIAFLQELHIYVHSSFSETMSTSILQAMSCGLPVIASDISGISNLIADGNNGLLFTKADVIGLTECIVHTINDEGKRMRLANNCRTYAVENFSHYEMLKKYLSIIKL